jgi:hypothetical protein
MNKNTWEVEEGARKKDFLPPSNYDGVWRCVGML